ncbi:MAG: ABC transporter permease [Melioribacteraceae bacterium]|nr:ABC transporter permease [Melioribacteraceae bacterium]
MFGNYLKLALRNFSKYKLHSFINLFGLTIGIAATILIMLYIGFQLSYDNFHADSGNIYRISVKSYRNGELKYDSYEFVPPLSEAMYHNFPEISNYSRFSVYKTSYFYRDGEPYKISNYRYADSTFFKLFSFKIVTGSETKVLSKPFTIVLTQSEAKKIFGSKNPIGKVLMMDNKTGYTVTAVTEDPPDNSHIDYSALVSFSTLYNEPGHYMDWKGGNQYCHYVTLNENATPAQVEAKLPGFMWKYLNEEMSKVGIKYEPYMQKFSDIHLNYNSYSADLKINLSVFTVVAAMILFMACINFINLSTAKSIRRSGEIGIRKVLGAYRSTLIKQLLVESMVITFAAVVLSLLLVEIVLQVFRDLTGENIPALDMTDINHFFLLILLLFLIGLLAGSYPAFFMTKPQPVKPLQNHEFSGKPRTRFRNLLIIFQFTIAAALIISTLFIMKQLSHIRNYDPGFYKKAILVTNLSTDELKLKCSLLKKEISNLSFVENSSAISEVPFNGFTSNGYLPQGLTEPIIINVVDVDSDFLNTFGLELIHGINFIKNSNADDEDYIINESLSDALNWDSGIGKRIVRNGVHNVRGVIKDFNYASLYNRIEPLIITNKPNGNRFDYLAIKINLHNIRASVEQIGKIWNNIAPNNPFEYWFLDDAFNNVYQKEEKFRQTFSILSILAISIALLGVIGLLSFTTEQRIKEIGIKKVLGASLADIIYDLTKSYLIIIGASVLAAWVIAFLFVSDWLGQFAYRIDQSLWIYIISGAAVFVISFVSIFAAIVKAGRLNTADALRYE